MSLAAVKKRIKAHPVEGSPHQMRRAFDALAGQGPAGEPGERAGVAAVSHGEGPDAVWLHGGGYVFGSPESHAAAAAYLAKEAGMRVWVPDYRLAPEHAWPAPLEDALAFVASFDSPVALVGDSAGGHLALNVARRTPDAVTALTVISPNTDRTGASTTRLANTDTDLMNSDRDDRSLAQMAMPGLPEDDPDASPLQADLPPLPPLFATASAQEVLLDDTLMLVRKLGLSGNRVEADIIPDLFHMWTLWPDLLPQARLTLRRIADFLDLHRIVAER